MMQDKISSGEIEFSAHGYMCFYATLREDAVRIQELCKLRKRTSLLKKEDAELSELLNKDRPDFMLKWEDADNFARNLRRLATWLDDHKNTHVFEANID